MELNMTARHLKLTPALSEYAQRKLEKAKKYFGRLIWAQVILDVEKNRHIAEFVVHAARHTFTAKEESADLYAAIDLASDKIDEQLRRHKERQRPSRAAGAGRRRAPWTELPSVLPEAPDPRVSSIKVLRLGSLTLPEAIRTMEQSESAHWIFINKDNDRVTVVYRKPDRTFGVVESIT
ncbi:MAG: ribosomal subunit interface protein [Elusimicrobia bacterium RIFCSPLOWO2_01_FULL_59_12]|nr:MAG: ribosomal subunit interface protein [Elusimicrobia bacterium RIFCSPLOWO2_01_FULL_59_12]